MSEGYVTLIGDGASEVIARLKDRQRQRSEYMIMHTAQHPDDAIIDVAPRPTPRQEAFDFGDPPLPGRASPPPRRTGWERDE